MPGKHPSKTTWQTTKLSSITNLFQLAYLQPLTKILRQIADLQEKLTFQAIWKVLNFSLEMTRLLKIEKWLEAWPLGCHFDLILI